MPQKTIDIDNLGPVLLVKRRGNTHLRLSVTAKGIVRVSMPHWVPYATAVAFAKKREPWITEQLGKHVFQPVSDGDRIGKSHSVNFVPGVYDKTTVRVKDRLIAVYSSAPYDSTEVQDKVRKSAEAVLKKEATQLLPQKLRELATKHGFSYSEVKIRKMNSRWGSCSSKKVITLSTYLMQLPWDLIEYVLVHELLHTRHMNHSQRFWDDFEKIIPGAKKLRKEVNSYKPMLLPEKQAY